MDRYIDWAFKYYKVSADAGNAEGMNNLGWCYQNAIGTEESLADAYYWYKEAASRGLHSGHHNLAWCLWNGLGVKRDDDLAQYHLEIAARAGNTFAIRTLHSDFKHSPFLEELRQKKAAEQREIIRAEIEEMNQGAVIVRIEN